jgi:O-antigen biosynthesis protein WbqP
MYATTGKRIFDFLVALAALLPAALICLVCVVAIRMESAGPGVFRQVRVGRRKRPFVLYKLRTMAVGTVDVATHEVSPAQITKVGRFLRRTKLDELPQLFNVLIGDMSIVGPRPCLPGQEHLIDEREQRGVFEMRPGITGPAQLAGIDMSRPAELAVADAAYAVDTTLWRDLGYIIATALGRGSGDAVKSG